MISATRLTLAPGLTCKFNCKLPLSLNLIGEITCAIVSTAVETDFFDLEDMNLTRTVPIPVILIMDQGSALIFLNGPKDRLEFSMDGVYGRTFSKFDGFHSVPVDTGVHFISYRINSGSEGAFVTFIFYPVNPKVFVFDWCEQDELYKLKHSSNEINVDKLLEYPGLISYDRFMSHEVESQNNWNRFTKFITMESVFPCFESKITDELYEVLQ